MGARKKREWKDLVELGRRKEEVGGKESKPLHRVTRNGAWINAIIHCLNGMELYHEKW